MAKVLHVEGLSEDTTLFFTTEPGESQAEVIRHLGGTFRVEEIPDELMPPPKLSEEATRFIAEYEREEADSVLAVYWRYHSLEADEFDTTEDAESYLDSGEEYGSLAGEAVVAVDGTVHVRP